MLQEKLKKHKALNDKINKLVTDIAAKGSIYNKVYAITLNKQGCRNRIEELKKLISKKQQVIPDAIKMHSIARRNLEKKRKMQAILKDYISKYKEILTKSQEALLENQRRLELTYRLYSGRKMKVLFVLGCVFFNERFASIFNQFIHIKDLPLSEKTDQKVGSALGFVVLLAISMSNYLNLPLSYPMIYNGPLSTVKLDIDDNYSLFTSEKGDKAKFIKGIELLIENLKLLLAHCGITFKTKYSNNVPMQLNEVIAYTAKYLCQYLIN